MSTPSNVVDPDRDEDSHPRERWPAMYAVVAARRTAYDAMMWQTPALSLTAQSFLFSIALAGDTSRAARLVAAALSMAMGALSIQLMMKHRHLEVLDSELLRLIEETKLGVWIRTPGRPPVTPHTGGENRNWSKHLHGPKWLVRRSSYRLWLFGLWCFVAAAGVVILLTCFAPTCLETHQLP